jgi:glutamate-ammonia-ligase adenylyltransferase
VQVLARMGEMGLLPEAERLLATYELYSTVLQAMSAALLEPLREDHWSDAFRELLAGLTHYPTFTSLGDDLAERQREVVAATEAWYERARRLP